MTALTPVALVGDAAGYLDALTGEGLALAFGQALHLGPALAAGDLAGYARAVRREARVPVTITRLALFAARRPALARRLVAALAADPPLFSRLLAALGARGSLAALSLPATLRCRAPAGGRARAALTRFARSVVGSRCLWLALWAAATLALAPGLARLEVDNSPSVYFLERSPDVERYRVTSSASSSSSHRTVSTSRTWNSSTVNTSTSRQRHDR